MPASGERVWDLWVRITHWSVAALVLIDLINEAGANPWHRNLGYVAAGLVLLRLAWGVVGPPEVRLASMARSAHGLASYARSLIAHRARMYRGHNPPGACMAFTLWGLILILAVTGWMLQLEPFWGDDTLQFIHAWVAYILAGCAVVHVSGAVFTSVLHRTNLIKAMITGEKRLAPYERSS
jgi:cytochrome b